MPLHPEIARALATIPARPAGPLDPQVMRIAEEGQVPPTDQRVQLRLIEDTTVETDSGDVPVRIYRHDDAPTAGVLVYLHGGAFFLGSLETHDHVCRSLAHATGLTVVAVDYRRAPEAPFPAGLDDCYSAIRWAADHAARLGSAGAVLAVAGDSSGGNLVAAVAAMARDDGFARLTHQVLLYPSLDLDFDVRRYASLVDNGAGYGLETAGLRPFNAFYLDSGADPADPLVSPIKRSDLAGLPPALIVTAEFDPLRDEGELYARRLRDAGVQVEATRYDGATHGFVVNFGWIPEFGRVFEEIRDFIRRH